MTEKAEQAASIQPESFAEFRDRLGEQIEVDVTGRGPSDRLADEIELDSVQRLEVLVAVEEFGVYLPDDSVGPEQTLGGLHERYVQELRAQSPG